MFRVSGLGVKALGCFWLEGLKVRMQHVVFVKTPYSETHVPKTEATNGNSGPEALRRKPRKKKHHKKLKPETEALDIATLNAGPTQT